MPYAFDTYSGNGSLTDFNISFPYINEDHVKVYVNYTQTSFTFEPNKSTARLASAPANGAVVEVRRITPLANVLVDYADGSTLTAGDLDTNNLQHLYIEQELDDIQNKAVALSPTTGLATANNRRITEVADPTAAQDAATKNYVDTTTQPVDAELTELATMSSGTASSLADLTNTEVQILDGATVTTTELNLLDGVTATTTEINYVDGVTSNVQTQLNAKQPLDAELTELATMASDTASSLADLTAAEVQALDGVTASTAELNILDGVTSTTAEINKLDGVTASTSELNLLDGVTATTAEINLIDGVTATTAELNYVDGVTSNVQTQLDAKQPLDSELTTLAGMQGGTASILASGTALGATTAEINSVCENRAAETTITNDDAKIPTSGAVVDYVAAQIAPLGGLEVVATEVAFPNTQPSSGVVISISDAGGVVVNGSGVSTTGRTVGGTTVTINGFPSSLHSETLAAGVGLMVSSTGSSQTYNYHKILGKEDDIKQLSDDINDFAARYRVGSSNPTSSLDAGDLFFNTGTNKLLVYNATNTAWEEAQSIGNFYISTFSESFDGSRTDFTLSNAPANAQQIIISINGVIQKPNSGTSTPSEGFALNGSTVKLSNAPASGSSYFAYVLGSTVNIGTPSNNTVSTAIIQNGAVTGEKIATNLDLADSKKIRFGTGNDLEIYHDGSHSRLDHVGTGGMRIQTNSNVWIQKGASEGIAGFIADGAVELYYDNSKKFETTSTGTKITGKSEIDGDVQWNGSDDTWGAYWDKSANIVSIKDNAKIGFGTSNDLTIYHSGGNNYIDGNSTAEDPIYIRANVGADHSSNIHLQAKSGEDSIVCRDDESVGLYYDGVQKLATSSTGATVTGDLITSGNVTFSDSSGGANNRAVFGGGGDLNIYHNGTSSLIEANDLRLRNAAGDENFIICTDDGSVGLYYDNSKTFETTANGITVQGPEGGNGILQIYADEGDDNADKWRIETSIHSSQFTIQNANNGSGWENNLRCIGDGSVELYYDNAKKFWTESWGVQAQTQLTILGAEDGAATLAMFADEGDDNADKWDMEAGTDGLFSLRHFAVGSWKTAWHCHYNLYHQAEQFNGPTGGVRFDQNLQNPTADQWSAYNGDGHLHRSTGQAYLTVDDHFYIRDLSSSQSLRFAFNTDTGTAGAQNDWEDDQFDFAEFFEWSDGNPDGEDRIGNTVAVDGLTGKIKIAEDGDAVIGVVSGTAAFTANAGMMGWQGQYLRDEWGRYIFEDNTNQDGTAGKKFKVNPDFDSTKEYQTRDERKEWDKIGIIGQCYVRKTAVKPSSWIKLKEVDSTKDFYLIK